MSVPDIERELKQLVSHDKDAYEFVSNLWSFVVVWDDAVDQDKAETPEEINRAMIWGLLGIQESPFYQKHVTALRPALYGMIASWLVANKFEETKVTPLLEQAYFLRCSPFEVFSLVAFLTGGFEKMLEAIEYFRGSFREDSLASYLKEHLER